jgi:hypothetical protein
MSGVFVIAGGVAIRQMALVLPLHGLVHGDVAVLSKKKMRYGGRNLAIVPGSQLHCFGLKTLEEFNYDSNVTAPPHDKLMNDNINLLILHADAFENLKKIRNGGTTFCLTHLCAEPLQKQGQSS